GSAMGYLYANVLGRTYPDSIVPDVINRAGPFRKLVPALYWSSDSGGSQGEHTFSFATDAHFTNTTKYNFLHVLPMAAGAIGTPPAGSGLLPYTDGPAAGKAVYDSLTGFSWALDGNLASTHRFGVSSTTTITTDDGRVLTVPLVDADGAMLFDTANGPGGWIDAMNAANYAGSSAWEIPFDTAFDDLFAHLTIGAGSVLFESDRRVEPFRNFQPFFYWACERGDTSRQAPCDPGLNPPNNPVDNGPMRWSFDFDEGFQGTDKIEKQFYVEVYYPAPRR
ncbi:MAG TPA: hypothetical protein VEU08_01495, partial [Vicinamibacterales bacterium]|nr:hypothetical protein [Vicinamibacterales bacterium]